MNWLLAVLTGVLLVLVFPQYDLAWLAPFALAPLTIAIAREKSLRLRFLLGYAAGLIYWTGANHWIQRTVDIYGGTGPALSWFVFALFCLAKAVHMGAFAVLGGIAIRVRWAVLAVPAVWVAIEWTHGPLGFAWQDLGNAGIDMSVPLRLAPFTGVYGLSFVFAMFSTALALAVLRRNRVEMLPLALTGLLAILPALPPLEHGISSAILVQPNIPDDQVWNPATFSATVQQLELLSTVASPDPARQPDLLVWPEIPAPFYEKTPEMAEIARRAGRNGRTHFLAGVVARTPDGRPLNSAALWDPAGNEISRYDKVNLVPFGEFVPWPLGYFAKKISTETGDFAPGSRVVVSRENGHSIGTFICYESVFPGFVRKFAMSGSQLLLNLSNDSWFGKSAARHQHLKIVRMRAVENARWILRATNDGITGVIDPAGRVIREAPSFDAVSTRVSFAYRKDLTVYTRYGDWFAGLCALLSVAGIWNASSTSGTMRGAA